MGDGCTSIGCRQDHLASIVADSRQRQLLSVLLSTSQPLTVRDLAVQLAARINGKQPTAVTATERVRIHSLLTHQFLPPLEETGVIRRDAGRIIVTDRRPFADTHLSARRLRELELPAWAWDAVAALVGRPHRQQLVSLVTERSPIGLERLTTHLTAATCENNCEDGRDDDRLAVVLHHSTLPALDDVDLIEYDPSEREASRSPRLSALLDQAPIVDEMCSLDSTL